MANSSRTARLFSIIAMVLVLALAVFFTAFKKVPLDRIGVRLHRLGGGIEERDLPPGYYLVLPGVHQLLEYDPSVHILDMIGPTALKLIGRDQYTTTVDITMLYRIRDGEAHRLALKTPAREQYQNVLRQAAEKLIWEVLGRMATEDFYNTDARMRASEDALAAMNRDLAQNHLLVDDVLIRNIVYDERFERQLLAKQLLGQDQQLAASRSLMEKELEKTQTIEKQTAAAVLRIQTEKEEEIQTLIAQTDARLAHMEADANLQAQKMLAAASAHRRQRIAEGELLKTEARAEGDRAINEAYAGRGGELLLARQMIENLEFGEIEINTNRVNPFDVEEMLQMIGARPATR